MMSLPEEDRYVLSKEELEDWLKVTLGGRAAEQVVFGRITNGAANDLERATSVARSMVFEWGMGSSTTSHQMRADNYALSEETKRLRDHEQREITDKAYTEALRLVLEPPRAPRPARRTRCSSRRRSTATEIDLLLSDLQPESNASARSASSYRAMAGRRPARCAPAEPALHSDRPSSAISSPVAGVSRPRRGAAGGVSATSSAVALDRLADASACGTGLALAAVGDLLLLVRDLVAQLVRPWPSGRPTRARRRRRPARPWRRRGRPARPSPRP